MDPQSLPADVEVTHINLNDGTCAGLLCQPKKAMSIQYHPEASPGPHDTTRFPAARQPIARQVRHSPNLNQKRAASGHRFTASMTIFEAQNN